MKGDSGSGLGQPAWVGAHLITLVSREREPLFGRIVDGRMELGDAGRIVTEEWQRIPALAPGVRLDAFAVMPNHIHGIVRLRGPGAGRRRGARRGRSSEAATLGAIVSQFKATSTRRVKALRGADAGPLWQPGYRDLPIESEQELDAVRRLVRENVARWAEDVENPVRAGQAPLPRGEPGRR